MAEFDSKLSEGTAVNALLDKPLHQLTEDDVAQLTREDCRRYLKEKGMRRPSWNKSQAMQQVIMLKTLLETPPDCDTGSRKRLRICRPNSVLNNNNDILDSVPKGIVGDALSTEERGFHCRKDLNEPGYCGDFSGPFAAANNDTALTRSHGSTTTPVGQMTIFYCGNVNVYDDVPADKVQAIMHMAASSLQFPQEQPVDDTMIMQPLHRLSNFVGSKSCPVSDFVLLPTLQTVKTGDNSQVTGEESNLLRKETPAMEVPLTIEASVLRYFERRKDWYPISNQITSQFIPRRELTHSWYPKLDHLLPSHSADDDAG